MGYNGNGLTPNIAGLVGPGGAGVPSTRTITTTAPLLIDGGSSADLSANRTLSILDATASAAGAMSAASYLGIEAAQIQIITSGTSATISAGIRLVVLSTAAGAFSLTPQAIAAGHAVTIWKSTTDANAITIVRTGSENIMGVAANYVIPGSTFASMLAWTLVDYDATNRIVI